MGERPYLEQRKLKIGGALLSEVPKVHKPFIYKGLEKKSPI